MKPGFINLKLANGFIGDFLNGIIEKGNYGIEKVKDVSSFVILEKVNVSN